MFQTEIDHLVVTAPSLAIGVEYVHDILGTMPQAGGTHPRMGTHNCLLRLGNALYLEVISIDPNSPKPNHPRWFNLDEVLDYTSPRLVTWVVRITDIRATSARASVHLGNIQSMSRGQFKWQITIPSDGSLPFDGVAPSLIEWGTQNHPASTLEDKGCTLLKLEGYHPKAKKISELLQSIGFEYDPSLFSILPSEGPSLAAEIQTPFGVRSFRSP